MKNDIESGDRFGKLVVIGSADKRSSQLRYLCRCDCGELVEVNSSPLKNRTRSCGCLRLEATKTHGMSSSSEYKTWQSMRQRCNNPLKTEYRYYGGRGISVCETWNDSFESFLGDVGSKPGPEYSLDRIDSDGDYEPGNVRWATPEEQWENRKIRGLSFDHFQNKTSETAIYPKETEMDALVYCTLGLAGEASEVAGKVKKIMRDAGSILTAEHRAKIADEMGDVLWYLSELASTLDMSLESIAARNLSKLRSRAERGTLQGSGDER